MRKPSDLKLYVDNKIKDLSYELLKAEEGSEAKLVLTALLNMLFDIQKICEKRRKY